MSKLDCAFMLKYILFCVDYFWFVFICFQNSIGKRIWKRKQRRKRKKTSAAFHLACSFPSPRPSTPFSFPFGPTREPAEQTAQAARGLLPSPPFSHRWRPGLAFFSHWQPGPAWQRPIPLSLLLPRGVVTRDSHRSGIDPVFSGISYPIRRAEPYKASCPFSRPPFPFYTLGSRSHLSGWPIWISSWAKSTATMVLGFFCSWAIYDCSPSSAKCSRFCRCSFTFSSCFLGCS